MRPQKNTNLPYLWQQRLYLMGFLLCVCMLAALGLWIVFLTPANPTPDAWLTETPLFDEERAGYSGGRARIAPGFTSNGQPHNEGTQRIDTPAGIDGERSPSVDSEPAVVAPPNTLALRLESLAAQSAPLMPSKPARTNGATAVPAPPPASQAQPVHSESGMGEITITALMPGARVNVANHVVTKAPTTLHVPWPANYTVAVHVDEATVYETQVHLSAENNRLSFAVDAVDPESDVG